MITVYEVLIHAVTTGLVMSLGGMALAGLLVWRQRRQGGAR